jgi:hypothetical protein
VQPGGQHSGIRCLRNLLHPAKQSYATTFDVAPPGMSR